VTHFDDSLGWFERRRGEREIKDCTAFFLLAFLDLVLAGMNHSTTEDSSKSGIDIIRVR